MESHKNVYCWISTRSARSRE